MKTTPDCTQLARCNSETDACRRGDRGCCAAVRKSGFRGDARVGHAAICSGAVPGLGRRPAGKFSRATGKPGGPESQANRRRAGRRFADVPEVASCLNPLTGFIPLS
ncbi:hypothetical protein K788_0003477 [Paraburkholderia caribensis MBA4]|uniref:Uncharacterized protein n=1 Tax=Paraburkholderia caribensis MBA4 TaxID=1323664 RepID=A0A0P0R597_9BURK|nr:hypothetical protein K788_0003477 [Paraburkholderia caribensis MBA4]